VTASRRPLLEPTSPAGQASRHRPRSNTASVPRSTAPRGERLMRSSDRSDHRRRPHETCTVTPDDQHPDHFAVGIVGPTMILIVGPFAFTTPCFTRPSVRCHRADDPFMPVDRGGEGDEPWRPPRTHEAIELPTFDEGKEERAPRGAALPILPPPRIMPS
jgi:hypothetical protein